MLFPLVLHFNCTALDQSQSRYFGGGIINVQILVAALNKDECASGTHNCSVYAVFNNTRGSYNCPCQEGYHGDGINCTGKYL